MSAIVERLATAEDLDGVLAIEAASFNNPTTREWYEGELKRPDVCFIYVMRTEGHRVAAFCAFWLVAEQAHINNLAVLPELRGRGLGAQLLAAITDEAAHLALRDLERQSTKRDRVAKALAHVLDKDGQRLSVSG